MEFTNIQEFQDVRWIGGKIQTGNNGCFKLYTLVDILSSNISGFLQTSLNRIIGMRSWKTLQTDPIRVNSEWYFVSRKQTREKPVKFQRDGQPQVSEPIASSVVSEIHYQILTALHKTVGFGFTANLTIKFSLSHTFFQPASFALSHFINLKLATECRIERGNGPCWSHCYHDPVLKEA